MRLIFTSSAKRLTVSALALPDEPAKSTDKLPPYERLLKGDDAKKAAELEKRIEQLEDKDDYASAIKTGEEVFDLRQRVQGPNHYETTSVKWGLELLKRVSALPAEMPTGTGPPAGSGGELSRI